MCSSFFELFDLVLDLQIDESHLSGSLFAANPIINDMLNQNSIELVSIVAGLIIVCISVSLLAAPSSTLDPFLGL